MRLIELFLSLYKPVDNSVFSATRVSEYPDFRVGIDQAGNPLLLINTVTSTSSVTMRGFKLKYLRLEHNLKCKIQEEGARGEHIQVLTAITFLSTDHAMREYFFKVCENLIIVLGSLPTPEQLADSLNKFIEVFRVLSEHPTKTIHGLWSELFLIDNVAFPETLLNYWHAVPEERFDFNAGLEKIEIKSSSSFDRVHIFSHEQLHPQGDSMVLIASVFVRPSSEGSSIQDLIENIAHKVSGHTELINKLHLLVSQTLGNALEQSIGLRYDYQIAQDSLCFYDYKDVPKIMNKNIPDAVSTVRYKSDLTLTKKVNPLDYVKKQLLFSALVNT